jgi:hypothetical protein
MTAKGAMFLGTGLLALSTMAGAADGGGAWVHVRVEEAQKESKVAVNLPFSLVQAALAAAPQEVVKEGRIQIPGHEDGLSVTQMRAIWKELKATGAAELVRAESKEQTVRVAREGDHLVVRVDNAKDKQQVSVDVPVAVVDALLSGEGETLDIKSALKAIETMRGDLVHVTGTDANVRVWIDDRNQP